VDKLNKREVTIPENLLLKVFVELMQLRYLQGIKIDREIIEEIFEVFK